MSVSLTKSDGCGKNNDCWALGPGLRYFEGHKPPLLSTSRRRVDKQNLQCHECIVLVAKTVRIFMFTIYMFHIYMFIYVSYSYFIFIYIHVSYIFMFTIYHVSVDSSYQPLVMDPSPHLPPGTNYTTSTKQSFRVFSSAVDYRFRWLIIISVNQRHKFSTRPMNNQLSAMH